jgi:hypothetical protein
MLLAKGTALPLSSNTSRDFDFNELAATVNVLRDADDCKSGIPAAAILGPAAAILGLAAAILGLLAADMRIFLALPGVGEAWRVETSSFAGCALDELWAPSNLRHA